MREITIKRDDKTTEKISSPWLGIADAARYLDISPREFLRKFSDHCPHKGIGRSRKFHVAELDKFNPFSDTPKDK